MTTQAYSGEFTGSSLFFIYIYLLIEVESCHVNIHFVSSFIHACKFGLKQENIVKYSKERRTMLKQIGKQKCQTVHLCRLIKVFAYPQKAFYK